MIIKNEPENFIQEYLYIEEYYPEDIIEEQEKEESERGVWVLNIFNDEEEV